MALFNALWAFSNFITAFSPNPFWVRAQYAFGALLLGSGLEWLFYLIGKEKKWQRTLFIYTVSASLALASLMGNLIIRRIEEVNFGFFVGEFGPLFYIYTLFILSSLIFIDIRLFRESFKVVGLKRQQMVLVSFGALIFTIMATVPSFVLPLFGVNNLSQLDVIGSFFYISLVTYSIVKYRLMNLRKLLTKSALYFLLTSVLASAFAFVLFFVTTLGITNKYGTLLVYMVLSLIIAVTIEPLKNVLAKISDDIFYKDKIDYQKVLRDLSIIIAKEIDLEILLSALRRAMMEDLKLKAVDILVEKKQEYISLTIAGKKLPADDPLLEYLQGHQDIVITDELYRMTYDLPEGQEQRKLQAVLDGLERNGIEFCAPIFLTGDLKALIILGAKQSGDIFTSEEVRFFNTLAPQVAVAIEKSQLYESIGEFNIQLQEKINRATKKLKEYNTQLQDANVNLKQLDKAKSEFLSIASHQLRTPISALKGYLSMLLEGDFGKLDPKQGKVISDLFESASRLARLINIFLNVSRIESGRFKLDRSDVDISTLVESVVKELQGQANAKSLKLTFDKNKHPISLYVDSDKVREVVLNLVDNAIKYTKEGSIAMRTFIDEGNYHFVVKDTGLGIRKEDAPVLFRKFVRGTGMSQVNTQGSGLGLYIAQRVISEHAGKIWAESEGYGKGSEFHFTIPLKENQKHNFSVSAKGTTLPAKESVREKIATLQ